MAETFGLITLDKTCSEAETKIESLDKLIESFEQEPNPKNFKNIAKTFKELYHLDIYPNSSLQIDHWKYIFTGESIRWDEEEYGSSVIYYNYDQKKKVGILNYFWRFYTISWDLEFHKEKKEEMPIEEVIQRLKDLVTRAKDLYKTKKKDSLTIRDKAEQDAKRRREEEREIFRNQN